MLRSHLKSSTVLLVLMALMAPLGVAAQPSWHQYYQPVEDPAIMAYVNTCLSEAENMFGRPTIPIKEIHIRQTINRTNRALIARADLVDTAALAKRCTDLRQQPGIARFLQFLPPTVQTILDRAYYGRPLTYMEMLDLSKGMNTVIQDKGFYDSAIFTDLSVKKPGGFKLSSLFGRTGYQVKNRQVLEALFPNCILHYGTIQKMSSKVAKRFNLCECIDVSRGAFVLYVSARPGSDRFYLEIAHETAHLLNAGLFDWYVEGLNNVFAEHMARREGRSWSPWQTLFSRGRNNEPYAISYYMMRDVAGSVTPAGLRSFLSHAKPVQAGSQLQEIDIEGWLSNLPSIDQGRAREAILRYSSLLGNVAGTKNAFSIPSAMN